MAKSKKLNKPIQIEVGPKMHSSSHGLWYVLAAVIVILLFAFMIKPQSCPECPTVQCPDCNCPVNDCSVCTVNTETQIEYVDVMKYVCADDRVVDFLEDCTPTLPETVFTPITTNEDGTLITSVLVEPRCVDGTQGGMVHFTQDALPDSLSFQVREQGTEYSDVYTLGAIKSGYKYFVICAEGETCNYASDFKLKKDTVYLFRAVFDRTTFYDRIEYSNEHVIDTRAGTEYITETCSEFRGQGN